MATNLLPINTLTIRSSAVSDTRRRSPTSSSSNWWTPLFGWSSDADYIDTTTNNNNNVSAEVPSEENIPAKWRYSPGCFTEEKAKQLRMMTKDSFHDVMYHSAIAARLASDFTPRQ